MKAVFIALTGGLLLLFMAAPALASGPTATYPPPNPTATSASLFLRPTPTLLSIPASTSQINIAGSAGPMADQAIQAYNTVNSTHIIDFILFALVAIFGLMMLVRNIGASTRNR